MPPDTPRPDPPDEGATLPPRTVSFTPRPATARDLPEAFGRYRVERKLGEGGMGAVYLARDPQLARAVAVKVPFLTGPDADAVRARFLREAQAAAALRHPNICPLFEVGEVDGTPYLVMPYVAGEPLSRRARAAPPVPVREAVEVVRKLALALDVAHRQGVIHRDLKPANVLIDERGEPVLMDFGLARRDDVLGGALTQEGDLMGTPAYMPPEQVAGEVKHVGPHSDVYSLGMVLYELLAGTLPFQGDLLSLTAQIALDPPAPPSRHRPGLPPRLDAVCLKALQKKPADRWPSMQHFADALGEWLRQDASPKRPASFPLTGALLTLRVEGTPYAYRPPPHLEVVAVGRQKRRPGEPPDQGNDLVLRVAGNDELSARISRRHFEVRRDGDDYYLVDLSKAGTLLNGRPAPKNVPTLLRGGDRLEVAGVVKLEVLVQEGGGFAAAPPVVHVPPPDARQTEQVVLEASLGDLVTVE
jgi:predicted Ser/Thr protein kinase